jgi:RNA polymerase sigma-70 factor (ECF subfamily)
MGAEILATHTPGAHAPDPAAALIARGDYRAALARCATEHGPSLGRLCMAFLGTQAEAEEAAQEALIAALDAMPSYRGEGTVRAWLFGIARRVCARRVETRVRRENRLRLVQPDEGAPGAEALLAARQQAHRVRVALEQLKPTEREAVVLRYDAGLSFADVAEACGIDEAAARKRVSRALERLRRALATE